MTGEKGDWYAVITEGVPLWLKVTDGEEPSEEIGSNVENKDEGKAWESEEDEVEGEVGAAATRPLVLFVEAKGAGSLFVTYRLVIL